MSGGVLLSHAVSRAVPSALKGLASGFGMEAGRFPFAMTAETLWRYQCCGCVPFVSRELHSGRVASLLSSYRLISTGKLHALPHFHLRPINPVVYWGPYQVNPVGDLILKQASRLDAFSGYPFRT